MGLIRKIQITKSMDRITASYKEPTQTNVL